MIKSKSPETKKKSENVSVHVSPKKNKEISNKSTPSSNMPPVKTPPAKTPPAKTPPDKSKTPPGKMKTPSVKTPAGTTPTTKVKNSTSEETETPKGKNANYWSFKSREGPSELGSKTLPQVGTKNYYINVTHAREAGTILFICFVFICK